MPTVKQKGIALASFEIVREEPARPPVKEIILRVSRDELRMLERNTADSGYNDDADLLIVLEKARIGSYS
jgi:hypothetical protein